MKNAFYFIFKAFLVPKIFKFLSWFFGHVEKNGFIRKIFSPVNEWRAIAFASPHKITPMWVILKIFIFLRRTFFGAPNENFTFETRCKAGTGTIMKIDFSARFYFARFVLFFALSIIFFAYFQQKWLLIHWLSIMCTSWSVDKCTNVVNLVFKT